MMETSTASTTHTNRRAKLALLFLGGLFFAFVLLDSLGAFDDKPYVEINHGNHTHYVPKDRDPSVSMDRFPTTPPGPGERITPQGQIVPAGP